MLLFLPSMMGVEFPLKVFSADLLMWLRESNFFMSKWVF